MTQVIIEVNVEIVEQYTVRTSVRRKAQHVNIAKTRPLAKSLSKKTSKNNLIQGTDQYSSHSEGEILYIATVKTENMS